MSDNFNSPSAKRRKLASLRDEAATTQSPEVISNTSKSLERSISPPLRRRRHPATSTLLVDADDVAQPTSSPPPATPEDTKEVEAGKYEHGEKLIRSPVQLTRIQDLAPWQNIDTVGLGDLLGDPMIRECWCFNYLFDLDFVM